MDPALIIDRRRHKVTLNPTYEPFDPEAEFTAPHADLPGALFSHSSISYASGQVRGYEQHTARNRTPNTVELWIEKELDEEDNPVLRDFCREEGINLVEGTGFMTKSTMHALLRRHRDSDKPIRILYLADFDDAGAHMPVGPARHIEYAIRNMDPKPDIKLHHLALTIDQVLEENIPRKIPTEAELKRQKEERKRRRKEQGKGDEEWHDGRKANFEARYGAGTVQLNALTSNPVRLQWLIDLLRTTVYALRDPAIEEKLQQAQQEAEGIVNSAVERNFRWVHRAFELLAVRMREVREEARARHAEERAEIERQMRELVRRQRELDDEVRQALAPFEERAERVRQVALSRADALEAEGVELPRVVPLEPEGATDGWLYDSSRSYLEQHQKYRAHKGL